MSLWSKWGGGPVSPKNETVPPPPGGEKPKEGDTVIDTDPLTGGKISLVYRNGKWQQIGEAGFPEEPRAGPAGPGPLDFAAALMKYLDTLIDLRDIDERQAMDIYHAKMAPHVERFRADSERRLREMEMEVTKSIRGAELGETAAMDRARLQQSGDVASLQARTTRGGDIIRDFLPRTTTMQGLNDPMTGEYIRFGPVSGQGFKPGGGINLDELYGPSTLPTRDVPAYVPPQYAAPGPPPELIEEPIPEPSAPSETEEEIRRRLLDIIMGA